MKRTVSLLAILAIGLVILLSLRNGPRSAGETNSVAPAEVAAATPLHEAPPPPSSADHHSELAPPPRNPVGSIRVQALYFESFLPAQGATVISEDSLGVRRLAATNADGEILWTLLPVGDVRLSVAAASSHWTADIEHTRVLPDATSTVMLLLRPREDVPEGTALIQGVVLDAAERRPLEGAVLSARNRVPHPPGRAGRTWQELDRVATTWDGRFELTVPRGGDVTVFVAASGHAGQEWTTTIHATDGTPSFREVLMEAGVTLRGVVRDPAGVAVKGGTVHVVREDMYIYLFDPTGDFCFEDSGFPVATTTDSRGEFEIGGLYSEGFYYVFAEAEPWARSPFHRFLIEFGGSHHAELTLQEWAKLHVRMLDFDGTPARASIFLPGTTAHWGLHAADRNGIVRMDKMVPEEIEVTPWFDMRPGEPISVRLQAGGTTDLTLKRPPGDEVTGMIVDDLGSPVRGAIVRAYRTATDEPVSAPITMSNEHGVFRIAHLPDQPLDIVAGLPGRMYGRIESVHAPAKDIRIVAQRTVTLRVRLRAPDKEVLPEAAMVTLPPRRGLSLGTMDEFFRFGSGYSHPLDDGLLELRGLQPGSDSVSVAVAPYAPLSISYVAEPDETVDKGDVSLGRGSTLHGVVRDLKGFPVAGARVTVGGQVLGPERNTLTDHSGRFTFDGLTEDLGPIRIKAEGFLDLTVPMEDNFTLHNREFVLTQGAVLTVCVKLASGLPGTMTSVKVHSRGSDGTLTLAADSKSDFRGRCTFRIPPGYYQLTIDGEVHRALLEANDGELLKIDLLISQ